MSPFFPWYVYGMWVYRADKMTPSDLRNRQYLDIEFATEYKLAPAYVQRVSLTLREAITLPTAHQDPNGHAMV